MTILWECDYLEIIFLTKVQEQTRRDWVRVRKLRPPRRDPEELKVL